MRSLYASAAWIISGAASRRLGARLALADRVYGTGKRRRPLFRRGRRIARRQGARRPAAVAVAGTTRPKRLKLDPPAPALWIGTLALPDGIAKEQPREVAQSTR
jgi:hypothetical protein